MENSTTAFEGEVWPIDYEHPPKVQPYWFEKADITWWKTFMVQNPNLAWYSTVLYLITIFGLQAFMKHRDSMRLKKTLIVWNASLALFSTVGFYRVGQELLYKFGKPEGYYGTVCLREGRNFTTDFWLLLFTLSKFVELGDTIFIVLRKQQLHALQWYHHGLVTIVSWKLFPWAEPIVVYYAVINFGIHSFMYSYFAVKGLGYRVPDSLAKTITTLQILQMVANTWNNLYTIMISRPCNRHPSSILWSLIIYISLWALFVKFFFKRYSGTKSKIN